MASTREVRNKIGSVKNTQKITKAMEMVAASKVRRAREHMRATRPYSSALQLLLSFLSQASHEYHHPLMRKRENIKKLGIIIISSDRGLCGGLNINLFREVVRKLVAVKKDGIESYLYTIGKKALSFFREKGNICASVYGLGDRPSLDALIGLIATATKDYEDGTVDEVILVKNSYVNSVISRPHIFPLFPIKQGVLERESLRELSIRDRPSGLWGYIYEPEAKDILTVVIKRYVEMQVLHAAIENVACEMSARMVAMKSASDNAQSLVDELQLVYNKARQASITQELSEIVAGAAAV